MNITLRKPDNDTFHECIKLKVGDDQQGFVASNMFSLAEAYADGVSNARAIYADEQIVGFIMYDFAPKESRGYITRLMVDAAHQGNGHGRAAMQQVIDLFKGNPDCREIYTSVVPKNERAKKLYISLGFKLTGEVDDGEEVLLIDLRTS